MDRLKDFRNWIIIIIAFYLFSNGMIYVYLHSEEIGLKLYNAIYQEEVANETK